MNVLFWGLFDFPVYHCSRDTSWNAWNRRSWSFMVGTGVKFSNKKYPSHEYSMTFWPSTSYTEFHTDQTIHWFHDLDTVIDLHRIMGSFCGAFETGLTCQQGTLILPDNWVRPLFMFQLLRPISLNLPCVSDFSSWISLDTVLILLTIFFFLENESSSILWIKLFLLKVVSGLSGS